MAEIRDERRGEGACERARCQKEENREEKGKLRREIASRSSQCLVTLRVCGGQVGVHDLGVSGSRERQQKAEVNRLQQ